MTFDFDLLNESTFYNLHILLNNIGTEVLHLMQAKSVIYNSTTQNET